MRGYYDAEKKMFIDYVPREITYSVYTADRNIELQGIVGVWLEGNELRATMKDGRTVKIYNYPDKKAAQKALDIFEEHISRKQSTVCI